MFNNKGFTLVEVLFAIFFLSMAVGGAFLLIQRNVFAVSAIEHRIVALGLAQEGVEAAYAIRNSNYAHYAQGGASTFTSNGLSETTCGPATSGCEIECVNPSDFFPECSPQASGLVEIRLGDTYTNTILGYDGDLTTYMVGAAAGGPSLFRRIITITESPTGPAGWPEYIDVVVEVSWDERGSSQSVQLETRIYQWLPI